MDLGCGKGGDLQKWSKAGITHFTGVDIADVSVEQAHGRYKDMSKRSRGRIFGANFFAADCTRKRLLDMYPSPQRKFFDLVSCQFAFHYCFETEEQAECMIRNAAESLKPGGFFFGTTPSAEAILSRLNSSLQQTPSSSDSDDSQLLQFGNSVYSVSFDRDSTVGQRVLNKEEQSSQVSLKDLPDFGNKYNFHLEGVVDCPEFLVNFDALVRIASKHGLMLVGMQKFENFFVQKRETPGGRALLERIRALETYPPLPGHALMGCDKEEENYRVAREFIRQFEGRRAEGDPYPKVGEPVYLSERDMNRRPLRVGTMSKDEWEAVTLYLTFAFKKKSSA